MCAIRIVNVTFLVAWCWTITCHGMTFEEVKQKYELLPAGSEDYLILPALRSLAQAAFAGALLYGNQVSYPLITTIQGDLHLLRYQFLSLAVLGEEVQMKLFKPLCALRFVVRRGE